MCDLHLCIRFLLRGTHTCKWSFTIKIILLGIWEKTWNERNHESSFNKNESSLMIAFLFSAVTNFWCDIIPECVLHCLGILCSLKHMSERLLVGSRWLSGVSFCEITWCASTSGREFLHSPRVCISVSEHLCFQTPHCFLLHFAFFLASPMSPGLFLWVYLCKYSQAGLQLSSISQDNP